MNTKHISQRFVSGVIFVLSSTSLALLLSQSVAPVTGPAFPRLVQSGNTPLLNMYQTFAAGGFERFGGGSSWWAHSLRSCLVATVVLTIAFSLFNLLMSRKRRNG